MTMKTALKNREITKGEALIGLLMLLSGLLVGFVIRGIL